MEKVIEIKNLTKKYGNFTAVDNISFSVEKGEIFGLLGENGAGKTTTLEIIEGLRKPTAGEIKVFGLDRSQELNEIKKHIGVQLQSSAYFAYLNLVEILDLFGSFYPKKMDPHKLLEMVDLHEKATSFVGKLSGGQKQRFSIVASLVNDPEVVFLDEPTTGLDPLARRNLWGLISQIKTSGKTVVLTTHYLEEAEMLCDHIAIMEKGRIVAMDKTHKLIERATFPFKMNFIAHNLEIKTKDKLQKLGDLLELAGKSSHWEMHLKTNSDLNQAITVVQAINPESFTVGKASLEDVFIELTGKKLES